MLLTREQQARKKPSPKELVKRIDSVVKRTVNELNRELRKIGVNLTYTGIQGKVEREVGVSGLITIHNADLWDWDEENLQVKIADRIVSNVIEKIARRYFNDDEWEYYDLPDPPSRWIFDCDEALVFFYPRTVVWFGLDYYSLREDLIAVKYLVDPRKYYEI